MVAHRNDAALLSVDLPPGPSVHPTLQLMNWIGRPLDWLDDCAQRYGDRFLVRLGKLPPAVFFSHPDAIQTIFKADVTNFSIGQNNNILRPLLGDESVILLDGERHQRQRQLLTPPFHGDRMRAYGELICNLTRRITAHWTPQQPFALRPELQEISLQVILHTVFGLSEFSETTTPGSESRARVREIKRLMQELLEATGSPLSSTLLFMRWMQQDLGPWSPWGRFVRQRAQLDELIYAEIRDRRAHPDPTRQDILTLMLSARDEAGQGMGDVELRDELLTLLVAGHETTASAISWALYSVLRAPRVAQTLQDELQTAIADGVMDVGAIARLPYLNAVCQETLRMYPVAPITFPRKLEKPFEVQGCTYPPGILVVPCIYLVHRNPNLYPEPTEFRPERFLERTFSGSEFVPFGGGNRRCLGMAFAQYEMKLVLATLLTTFHLHIVGDQPIKPRRRGVTLAPSSSLKVQTSEGDRPTLSVQTPVHR